MGFGAILAEPMVFSFDGNNRGELELDAPLHWDAVEYYRYPLSMTVVY